MIGIGSREETEYEKIDSQITGISLLTLTEELVLRPLSNFEMDNRR